MRKSSVRRYLAEKAMWWLPPTRLYRLKARLLRAAGVDIDQTARIVSSVSIIGPGAVKIGCDTFIGHRTVIIAAGAPVQIGAKVDIGPGVFIGNGSHEINMAGDRSAGAGYSAPITIGDAAWIGAGSVILPGVFIGEHAVVGAGSVVVRDIPPFTVSVGVPCRPVKWWDPAGQAWHSQEPKRR
jgi:acetyltransferase-like isoleucine patch superfamily enzyme